MSFTQPQSQSRSGLPPATQLFLDSLKAGAKLQTPNGQPTVAAQAAQNAGITQPPQQAAQPSGVPPVSPDEGQQGLAGILDQLKQAQQAGPSVAANQQQAQAQQLAQQAAQAPKAMAEGGLANLPITVGNFAEGGIIGFDDGGGVDIMGNLTGMEQPESNYRPAPKKPTDLQFQYAPNTDIAAIIAALQRELTKVPPAEKAQLQAEITKLSNLVTPTSAQEIAPAAATPARPDAITLPPLPTSPSPEPVNPSLAGIMSEINAAGFTKPDLSKMQSLAAEKEKLLRSRPDFGAQDIATATRIQQMAEEQDDQQRRLAQFASGIAGVGGGARMAGATANYNQMAAQRNAAYLQMVDAAKQAEFGRQTKDLDLMEQSQAALVAAQQKYQELTAQLAAHLYSGQAGITQAGINAQSRAEVAAERMRGMLENTELRNQLAAGKAVKPPPGMSIAEVAKLDELVDNQFGPNLAKSGVARKYLSKMPGGEQLLIDLEHGRKIPEILASETVMRAKDLYRKDLLRRATKYIQPAARTLEEAESDEG